MLLPCIACGAVLHPAMKNTDHNQPYAGTVFKTYGGYGSTVFDPMDNCEYLEVTICDGCLIKNKNRVLRYAVVRFEHQVTEAAPWVFTEDDEATWREVVGAGDQDNK
jgi:hypothetical protein